MYKEKNGIIIDVLIMTVKILFASIYDYDRGKNYGNVIVWKVMAKGCATDKVGDYLFLEDSSKSTAVVNFVLDQTMVLCITTIALRYK